MAKGNSEAEFLYEIFSEVLEEVRDKALAREKKKKSGPNVTALKTASYAGASSSSLKPRFDKHHGAKAKAKAAAPKAVKSGAVQKALNSKYASAADSGSWDGTGSDGDGSLDERINSGRAVPTPVKHVVAPKKRVLLNLHIAVHISAATLVETGVPVNSANSVTAEIACRPGKPFRQVCVSGFLRRAAASSLCVIICPCFGFVATR